ncbi:hypothetical protein H7J06_10760 [Mycobacterium hodleri]|uniref:hypothetical protein n=1 Tax=Mycolicibacterium hodleri TaxID=49897 RepID=UPI0021F2E4F4|nr:hypothetical protein [Mycolicibacterium hodleri]MCV7133463.1 hypothetical protein [Mycolicibacterium hodleri]
MAVVSRNGYMNLAIAPGRKPLFVVPQTGGLGIKRGNTLIHLTPDEAYRLCDAVVDILERQ